MKNVILPKDGERPIYPDATDPLNKYYGFSLNDQSHGFIMKNKDGTFSCLFFYSMTNRNEWGKPSKSLAECIETLLKGKDHKVQVFEFDSYEKLFLWGSNK